MGRAAVRRLGEECRKVAETTHTDRGWGFRLVAELAEAILEQPRDLGEESLAQGPPSLSRSGVASPPRAEGGGHLEELEAEFDQEFNKLVGGPNEHAVATVAGAIALASKVVRATMAELGSLAQERRRGDGYSKRHAVRDAFDRDILRRRIAELEEKLAAVNTVRAGDPVGFVMHADGTNSVSPVSSVRDTSPPADAKARAWTAENCMHQCKFCGTDFAIVRPPSSSAASVSPVRDDTPPVQECTVVSDAEYAELGRLREQVKTLTADNRDMNSRVETMAIEREAARVGLANVQATNRRLIGKLGVVSGLIGEELLKAAGPNPGGSVMPDPKRDDPPCQHEWTAPLGTAGPTGTAVCFKCGERRAV